LAVVASRCEYNYGFSGRVGFLYDSAKDQMKWIGLSAKQHLGTVMRIGEVMALRDEDYQKAKVKAIETPQSSMAAALKAAFGDGGTQ